MSKGAVGKAGWQAKKLRDVTTKIGSGATPLGGEGAYKESGTCLIRSLNVLDWGFREAKLARRQHVTA
jgi:type I restriction enzyme S subunit